MLATLSLPALVETTCPLCGSDTRRPESAYAENPSALPPERDAMAFLRGIFNRLKLDGQIIISTPNYSSLKAWCKGGPGGCMVFRE